MLELTQWWQATAFSEKPWLILGKGPTFSVRRSFDLSRYNLLSLNHVVEQQPVDVAHIIDIDVVEDCGEALLKNCRWLLMPRRPHVDCAPGKRRLEDYFAELPVLRRLDNENRLVWYNLASGNESVDSPVISARYFSAEAALDLLSVLGVRQVRSLGIDGGRGYSADFQKIAHKTMLANGHETFDCQFDEIERLIAHYGIDYAPLAEPMRVFVGADESQRVAARVLEYSIRKHASRPVVVQPMFHLPLPKPRKRRNRPRTGFSFYRFAIPRLCGYRGRALYLDADMQVFDDLAELWDIPFGDQTILCTNQPQPPEQWRGTNSFFKPGRQMSVMLLDCSRLRWDAAAIIRGLDEGRYSYQELMCDLCIVPPEQIRDGIPPEWNCLEWFEAGRTKLLHYTVVPTQPWKNDENILGPVWMDSFREAVAGTAVDPGEVLYGIRRRFLKPSLGDGLPNIEQKLALRGYLNRRVAGEIVGRPPSAGINGRLRSAARKSVRLVSHFLCSPGGHSRSFHPTRLNQGTIPK